MIYRQRVTGRAQVGKVFGQHDLRSHNERCHNRRSADSVKQPLENLGKKFKHVHNRGELQGALNDEGSRQAKQGPETYWAPATKSKTCGAAHARNKYVNPGDARFYVE